ncbi:unnamed protein product [Heligmosomoides polygyrus]|uniref:DUF5683 domain-containing protein n=1 Tax=Heligmosomoides polygyrus TaxID=6339 RepID=A0A183FQ17_HELPZ|nr:unnamed protein product [Heligmosomoides polygyrus]
MGAYRSVEEAKTGLANFVNAMSGPNLSMRPLKSQIRNAEWFTILSARQLKPHRFFFDIIHSVTYSTAFEAPQDPAPSPLSPASITFPDNDDDLAVVWDELFKAQPNNASIDEVSATKNKWLAVAATILIATGEKGLMPTDSSQTWWMYLMIVISLATDPVEGKLFSKKEARRRIEIVKRDLDALRNVSGGPSSSTIH